MFGHYFLFTKLLFKIADHPWKCAKMRNSHVQEQMSQDFIMIQVLLTTCQYSNPHVKQSRSHLNVGNLFIYYIYLLYLKP